MFFYLLVDRRVDSTPHEDLSCHVVSTSTSQRVRELTEALEGAQSRTEEVSKKLQDAETARRSTEAQLQQAEARYTENERELLSAIRERQAVQAEADKAKAGEWFKCTDM